MPNLSVPRHYALGGHRRLCLSPNVSFSARSTVILEDSRKEIEDVNAKLQLLSQRILESGFSDHGLETQM